MSADHADVQCSLQCRARKEAATGEMQHVGEAEATRRFMTVFEQTAVEHGSKTNERQYNYVPRPTDVIVVGPPKTGTTWVQQILHQIRTKGDMSFKDIYDVSWWLPYYFMQVPNFDFSRDQPANPRILKSHERYETIPKCDGMKYVVIFRTPNDASYSYMKFLGGFLGAETESLSMQLMLTTQDTEICKLTGGVPEMVISWWNQRGKDNVLWLYYEDLQKDLAYCVDRLAEFIGIPLTPEERNVVIKNSSFEVMAANKDKFSGEAEVFAKAVGIEGWKPKAGMVRASGGQVGQGSEHLPELVKAQNAAVWKKSVEKKLGYKNYNELYEATSLLKEYETKNGH